jgi:hypothetical protein
LTEDPSKPKRPFFSPFAKELLELILKSLAPESDSKPKRTRRKLPGEREGRARGVGVGFYALMGNKRVITV